ncbi:outer membrane beta-barrel domain-containing protein [Bdellovibrio sp. HCB288]|uniref:outer membrane beta-barrel domain-containing protein n=1 Tax=Bdellovibrio sp. HCB288 TaxID=3394355 RepID=UPI0039B3B484
MFKKTLLIFFVMTAQAFAQTATTPAAKPTTTDSRGSDKLDIKKLENKYWAAKDEDFGVVQNRRYVKAERFYLTGKAGIPFNDAYSTGTIMGLDLGYFLNERWGFELSYDSADMKNNDAVDQFISTYGAIPDHNVIQSSYFVSAIWVPFYAKMSALDKAIIYFDMGVSVGLGNVNYKIAKQEGDESKSAFGYKLGIFQQIFFSEHFALRADLINTWSNQEQSKYYYNYGGNAITGRDLGSKMVNDTSLMIGITYWH